MSIAENKAEFNFNRESNSFHCEGSWSIQGIGTLVERFRSAVIPTASKISINAKNLDIFDSAGALALCLCIAELKKRDNSIVFQDFKPEFKNLYELVETKADFLDYQPKPAEPKPILYRVGEQTVHKLKQADGFVSLVGDLSTQIVNAFQEWRRFHWPSIVVNVYATGVTALPILALLSFLIGVVLAYQLGLQLENYGANGFIAYISGMAIFREFGPLITAIIVAGRTSSSFTAQIGSMKINEEVDAIYTMGLSPTELLVVPKVIGLFLVFPLLIFWSDLFSVLGSMYMSKVLLNVGYMDFLTRLQESVGTKQLMLGLYKAPIFALLIALVGCFQGFRVEASADSVGAQTTKSVVQALFLIIIADAIYSVIYSWMGL